MNLIEKDEHGLYIHADNYQQCLAEIKEAKRKQDLWDKLPWWKHLFLDKFKWHLSH